MLAIITVWRNSQHQLFFLFSFFFCPCLRRQEFHWVHDQLARQPPYIVLPLCPYSYDAIMGSASTCIFLCYYVYDSVIKTSRSAGQVTWLCDKCIYVPYFISWPIGLELLVWSGNWHVIDVQASAMWLAFGWRVGTRLPCGSRR